MSQSPTELQEFQYESSYADAAAQLNKLVRAGKSYSGRERNRCFLNVEGQQFANASLISGFDFPEDGRAIAICDWDGDGDLDFWVANRTAPQLRLMQNQVGNRNSSVCFRLRGTKSNRDAIGARVSIRINNSSPELHRTLRAGEGFLACHSKELHFGLASASEIQQVQVRWPSGSTESFQGGTSAGNTYLLEEGTGIAKSIREHRPISAPAAEQITAVPKQSMATHNLLLQAAPMPPLMYESAAGGLLDASVPSEKPTLVNLWAAWCAPCIEEIEEWSKDYNELEQQVQLLTLSVDKLSNDKSDDELDNTTRVLQELGYRGQSGWATSSLLDVLQQTHNAIYDHHRALPLPSSFLLDRRGNLRAVYKGPVSSSRILQDVKALSENKPESALPFAGRWMAPLGSHNLQLLVEELFREGYETEAQAYVERLTDDQFQARLIGARLFLAQQLAATDPAAAMRHSLEAVRVAPDNAKAHERIGLLYARAGKAAEAKHHFKSALQHQTKPEARTHYNFGKLLRSSRSNSEAREQFSKAIAVDPKYDLAYEQLGLIHASQRQFEEAAKMFATAAAIQPSTASYRVNHAMALTQLNRSADAWQTLQPIIAQPDIPPMALLLGARSLGNLKRFSEAIPLLERFLQNEPNAADVRKQLQFMREKSRTQ